MISLDSIFKSRDITLPTKIRLVKAMVFPVVLYGCESWTVKKAACRRIDAFAGASYAAAAVTMAHYKVRGARRGWGRAGGSQPLVGSGGSGGVRVGLGGLR